MPKGRRITRLMLKVKIVLMMMVLTVKVIMLIITIITLIIATIKTINIRRKMLTIINKVIRCEAVQ